MSISRNKETGPDGNTDIASQTPAQPLINVE